MDLLIKLKEGLVQLNKKNVPKRLQKGVISCTNECEGVIQKVKMEKSEIERQLESSSARIEELTSELAFYRSAIYGKGIIILFILRYPFTIMYLECIFIGMPHQHPSLSTSKDNISKSSKSSTLCAMHHFHQCSALNFRAMHALHGVCYDVLTLDSFL